MYIIPKIKLMNAIETRLDDPNELVLRAIENTIKPSDYTAVDPMSLRRDSVHPRELVAASADPEALVDFIKEKQAKEIAEVIAKNVQHRVVIKDGHVEVISGIDILVKQLCLL